MTGSTEQRLRDLFAADAAAAPEGRDLVAGARGRVRRRRRIQAAWATAAVITTMVVVGLERPPPPEAQIPTAAPTSARPSEAKPSEAKPGGSELASCVKGYSPATLAKQDFAFDGTVVGVGPGITNRRDGTGILATVGVSFHVNVWFKGGTRDTVVVDMMPAPAGRADWTAIGTRLLVSGMPRWGGAPLDDPIAWECGFTRYYSPGMAAEWAEATGKSK
ncbi:hypothetical protein [Winogradskya humida]|uniref:Uncharacterized protein n=1 Tax=Winogradskya humida TaxID=113566 RepID=A0ABQ3ZJD9_9ACTN|nr:hypothetical protein [Actinoplanes humidus]GIE18673.1 hypothetical protein Ahu01nite_017750 [Actinoplanes humidus]